MDTPPARTEAEAHDLVAEQLERLADRRQALGEAACHAVAGWTLQMGYEFEAAAMAYAKARELDPADVQCVFNEGVCRLELEAYDAAAELFLESVELDDAHAAAGEGERLDWFEEDPFHKLGNVHHARGDLAGAVEAYTESARRNVGGTDALIELVRCGLAMREPKAALDAIARLEKRAVCLSLRAQTFAYRAEAEAMLAADDA